MDGEIIEFTKEPVAQSLIFHKAWVMTTGYAPVWDTIA
jgi:hypothetical protein